MVQVWFSGEEPRQSYDRSGVGGSEARDKHLLEDWLLRERWDFLTGETYQLNKPKIGDAFRVDFSPCPFFPTKLCMFQIAILELYLGRGCVVNMHAGHGGLGF